MITCDILQAGTNSHGVTVEDFNAFQTDFISDGIVGAVASTAGVAPTTGGFAVNAQVTPNMSVAVGTGVSYITGTPTDGVSQRLRIKSDLSENVTISANTSGSTRYDWLYIKLDADKMKNPSVNSSDVATLITSRSTSSSTDNGTPPTYGYCIAVVTVANGAVTIQNANITDKRTQVLPTQDSSSWKDYTATVTNISTSSKVARYKQIGKTVHYTFKAIVSSGSSGVISVSIPVSSANQVVTYSGIAWMVRQGVAYYLAEVNCEPNSSVVTFYGDGGSSPWGVGANPATWTSGDIFRFSITYEAA